MRKGSTIRRVTLTGVAAAGPDRHQEPVTAARQRFDEAGGVRRVAEDFANLADAEIQSLLEVHERVAVPDVLADLVACHHFAAAAGEELEHHEGLRRQLEHGALPA